MLHDNLQQLLVAAQDAKVGRLGKQTADQTLEREQLKDVEQIARRVDRRVAVAGVEGLSPPVLNEAGLAGGLQWLAHKWKTNTGCAWAWRLIRPPNRGTRCHGFFSSRRCESCCLTWSSTPKPHPAGRLTRGEGATIRVDVGDDGVGADPARQAWGFGLASVHQRVEILGGHLEMEASPGRGTEVSIFVPQRQAAAPSHGQLPV